MKHHLARHGIPDIVITDGGPQYTGEKFQDFSKSCGFSHEKSNPGNSKANGAAEAAVKTAKRMMRKCKASKKDPYIGLLNLRNTPTEGLQTSPAQRLLGRETKTQIPTTLNILKAKSTSSQNTIEKQNLEDRRAVTVERVDRQRTSKELRPIKEGDTVRMQPIQTGKTEWKEATVSKQLKSRTYEVYTEEGRTHRRNRQHLRATKKSRQPEQLVTSADKTNLPLQNLPQSANHPMTEVTEQQVHPSPQLEPSYTTRSGRVVKSAKRLDL